MTAATVVLQAADGRTKEVKVPPARTDHATATNGLRLVLRDDPRSGWLVLHVK